EVGLADRRRQAQLRYHPHAESRDSERHGDRERGDPEPRLGLTAYEFTEWARGITEAHEMGRFARRRERDERVGKVVHAYRLCTRRVAADYREHPELRRGLRGASHEPVVRVAVDH